MKMTEREEQTMVKFRWLRKLIEPGGRLAELRFDPYTFGYQCAHVAHVLSSQRGGTPAERRHRLFEGVWPQLAGPHVRNRFERILSNALALATGRDRDACELGLGMAFGHGAADFGWPLIFLELVFEVQFDELADACERLEKLRRAYDAAPDPEAAACVREEIGSLLEESRLLLGTIQAEREISEPFENLPAAAGLPS